MNRFGFIATGIISLALIAFAFGHGFTSSDSASAAAGQGTLYGTDAGVAGLYEINPNTGAGTFLGNMPGGTAPSLAVDPVTGNVYHGTGGFDDDLYLVNVATPASSTLIGSGGLGGVGYGGMDFDDAGVLYASANIAGGAGTGSDHLITINTSTGAATIVGPYGTCSGLTIPAPSSGGTGSCTIEGMEGIAFDSSGMLWGALNERGGAGTPGLYTINPATGAATFVTGVDDTGAGLHPSGGISTIQFACDGTLYGGSARRQGAGNNDGGVLGTINPTTGEWVQISASPITTGSPANSLGGLAFADPCTFDVAKDFIPDNPGSVNVNVGCSGGATVDTIDGTASEADDANFRVSGFALGTDPFCTATESGVPAPYLTSGCNALLSAGGCTITNVTPTPAPTTPPPTATGTAPAVGGLVDIAVTPGDDSGGGTALLALLALAVAALGLGGVAFAYARQRN